VTAWSRRTATHFGARQVDTEMAAPVPWIEDPNWHRSEQLHQECEWKQGESARGRKNPSLEKEDGRTLWRLPLVGDRQLWLAGERFC